MHLLVNNSLCRTQALLRCTLLLQRRQFAQYNVSVILFSAQEKCVLFSADFRKTHNCSTALSGDLVCRIWQRSDNKCEPQLIYAPHYNTAAYNVPIFIEFPVTRYTFVRNFTLTRGVENTGEISFTPLSSVPPTFQSTDWHETHSLRKSSEQTTEERLLTNKSTDQYYLSGDDNFYSWYIAVQVKWTIQMCTIPLPCRLHGHVHMFVRLDQQTFSERYEWKERRKIT